MGQVSLLWTLGVVLGGIGLLAAAWGLIGDRPRGRRRCPKCWYDMSGLEGRRCPECGREAKSEKRLHRPRRRWRIAMLGLLFLLIAGGLCFTAEGQRRGWENVTPNTALILIAKFSSKPWALDVLEERLEDRFGQLVFDEMCREVMWRWQWRSLSRTCVQIIQANESVSSMETAIIVLDMCTIGLPDEEAVALIPVFMTAAKSPHPAIRREATASMPWIADDDQADSFFEDMLHDPDVEVRHAAIMQIGERAEGSDHAFIALVNALKHPDAVIRAQAAGSLGDLTEVEQTRATVHSVLLQAAREDANANVREEAIRALAHFGLVSSESIDLFYAATSDVDDDICNSAIWALYYSNSKLPAPIILRALGDQSRWVRITGCFMLREPQFRAELLQHHSELEAIMKVTNDDSVKDAVMHFLGIDSAESLTPEGLE